MVKQAKTPDYQNNPFVIATDGLTLLFKNAKPIAIVGLALSALGLLSNIPSQFSAQYEDRMSIDSSNAIAHNIQSIPTEAWIIIGVIGLFIVLGMIVIGTFISGIFDYTAAKLADNKTVTMGEAVKAVAARFFNYLGLEILIAVKVLLWSLLFIVPGIIMATRYSLSGVSFFRHNMTARAAIGHSSTITKGAWLTTFGSFGLFNLITFGIIQALLQPGTSGLLQRQFDAYHDAKLQKPSAHALSWLMLGLVGLLFVLAVGLILLLAALANYGFSEGHIPTF
jgi:hypothetical protein